MRRKLDELISGRINNNTISRPPAGEQVADTPVQGSPAEEVQVEGGPSPDVLHFEPAPFALPLGYFPN